MISVNETKNSLNILSIRTIYQRCFEVPSFSKPKEFAEFATSLRRCPNKPRTDLKSPYVVMRIRIKQTQPHDKNLLEQQSNAAEQLWDEFETCLSKTLPVNIPKNLKQRNLPWIINNLRRKMNKLIKKR